MNDIEKLRMLLPHWMEHNSGHEAECIKWADIARKEGLPKVAEHIDAAVKTMKDVNEFLGKALEEAGGPGETDHHHHHHH